MNASSHGIGLNICLSIAEALQGKLYVKSEGSGSEFGFIFDAKISPPVSFNYKIIFFFVRECSYNQAERK